MINSNQATIQKVNIMSNLNKNLVKTIMDNLQVADSFTLNFILNKLNINMQGEFSYSKSFDEIEDYCFKSLKNTMNVISVLDDNGINF